MSNQKIIKAIAGIAAAGMMATCLPVAAFAATGDTSGATIVATALAGAAAIAAGAVASRKRS